MTNTTAPTDEEIDAAYRKVWSTVPHAQRLTAFAHEIGATLAARWGATAPVSADVRAAAQAIVDHWDTPSWGYSEYTESFIRRLREALAAPPAPEVRAPLSDGQVDELASPYLLRMFGSIKIFKEVMRGFARTIERAHGITAKEPT